MAVGVRCALQNKDKVHLVEEACTRASGYDAVLGGKIKVAFKKKDDPPNEILEEMGTSYLVDETVPSAFYCVFRHFDEPEKAILEAVNAGGDTDSIACITGALCGGWNGIEAFPVRWIEGLDGKDDVSNAAEMLFKMKV